MPDPVKPALTAEEWAGVGHPEHEITRLGKNGDPIQFMTYWGWASPEARHAAAAYALHGQPFGFTREDVEMLTRLRCFSLASRIAALLPPEPEALR